MTNRMTTKGNLKGTKDWNEVNDEGNQVTKKEILKRKVVESYLATMIGKSPLNTYTQWQYDGGWIKKRRIESQALLCWQTQVTISMFAGDGCLSSVVICLVWSSTPAHLSVCNIGLVLIEKCVLWKRVPKPGLNVNESIVHDGNKKKVQWDLIHCERLTTELYSSSIRSFFFLHFSLCFAISATDFVVLPFGLLHFRHQPTLCPCDTCVTFVSIPSASLNFSNSVSMGYNGFVRSIGLLVFHNHSTFRFILSCSSEVNWMSLNRSV